MLTKDSNENQFPLHDKRKNPNNEGSVEAKKAKISSDEISTELKKKANNFNIEKAVCWEKEESVPFSFIATALDEISKESDPIVVTEILCNMLRTVIEASSPEDLVAVLYLLSENQRIVPPRDIEFDFGYDEIQIAIAETCQTRTEYIEREVEKLGDLGLVAKFWRTNAFLPWHNQANPLTVVKVYETFKKFAEMHPTVVKKDLLRELLEAATGCEPLYLIYLLQRMLQGAQKIVLAEQTLLTALGHAALYSEYSTSNDVDPLELENAAKVVEQLYSCYRVYDKIVPGLLYVGVRKLLHTCNVTPGIPFEAMLPEHTIGSIPFPLVSIPNDSNEKQTPNLNTNPNNEVSVGAKICSDENSTELKKKAKDFDVEKAVFWEKKSSVPFLFMANALDEISKESDPIVVTDILRNMLLTVIKTAPNDLAAFVYLLSEKIVPPHVLIEFDIDFGHEEIQIAIAEACKTRTENIVKDFEKLRDLGLVAKAWLRKHIQANSLTVVKVFETFKKFAKICPTVVKKDLLRGLLEAATGCEPLYLIYLLQRIIQGARRIILTERTLLTALGQAVLYSEYSTGIDVDPLELENAAMVVKQVYSRYPVYDKIVPDLISVGVRDVRKLLDTCAIAPGIPFKAMLPDHTIGSTSEIRDKFQAKEFTCEYEYPGKRAMIHYWKTGKDEGRVEVYGWNGYRITGNYEDVAFEVFEVARLKELSLESFIIDCHLVAYDRENKKIIPSKTRDTCRDIDSKFEVKVCVFAFDILYHNGEQLLQKPLKYRREVLRQSFEEKPGVFHFAHYSDSKKHEDILKFIEERAKYSCERLIIKTLTEDAAYEPDIRFENWLELEIGYVEYIPPLLNLVPIACHSIRDGEYNFVLASYDDKSKEYQYMCTIGPRTCPKDILEDHFKRLNLGVTSKVQKECYKYHQTWIPQAYTWFEPTEVWQVKVDGLYTSSVLPIEFGTVNPIKGICLVSPRLVGVLGEIGPLNQPTSPDKVVELYKASKHTHDLNH